MYQRVVSDHNDDNGGASDDDEHDLSTPGDVAITLGHIDCGPEP